MNAFRSLWMAVLAEQVRLALSGRDVMGLQGDAVSAARWIGGKDFRLVCALAGVDPTWIERKYAKQAALPLKDRIVSNVCRKSHGTRGRALAA